MKWSENVKELMILKGINQKELSRLSGITEASVSRYLKGNRTPRIDIVINFAKALDVEVDDLLEEDAPVLTPFESIKGAIARHGTELSEEEQQLLINMLLGKED